MDLVKIMLFMEPRAHGVYSQKGLHDQFLAQPNTHNDHAISRAMFPTPTGARNASITNGSQNMGYVEMWKWHNMIHP